MTMRQSRKTIPAGQFKAQCLGLLDQVSESKEIIVVTKHGKPIAKVIPFNETESPSLRGSVNYNGDIVEPTGESWNVEL